MGQKFILLEKAGTVNNYKYYVNDRIVVNVKGSTDNIKGKISRLLDSSMIIDYNNEIKYGDIREVLRPMWVKHWLPELLIKASVGYFTVYTANNILQHMYPILTAEILLTTAGLAGAGYVLSKLLVRHYPLGTSWRIRLLDFENLPNK
jgi:hypothetical protein